MQVKDSYRKFVRQGRCLGHSSPVVCLDWSQDGVRMIMIMMIIMIIIIVTIVMMIVMMMMIMITTSYVSPGPPAVQHG